MKKRNESSLVTAILNYLKCLENAKKIIYADRLNSGAAMVGKRRIRLCRKGTPDIMVILGEYHAGEMLWIEAKADDEPLAVDQYNWKVMIEKCPGHTHLTVRDIDGLIEHLKYLGVE